MKITFKERKPEEYPCVKCRKIGDIVNIALFFSERQCVILYTTDPDYKVGRQYIINCPCDWDKFEGEVVLQND